jgi:hypothetical protein
LGAAQIRQWGSVVFVFQRRPAGDNFVAYIFGTRISGRRSSNSAPTSRTRPWCGSTATSGPNVLEPLSGCLTSAETAPSSSSSATLAGPPSGETAASLTAHPLAQYAPAASGRGESMCCHHVPSRTGVTVGAVWQAAGTGSGARGCLSWRRRRRPGCRYGGRTWRAGRRGFATGHEAASWRTDTGRHASGPSPMPEHAARAGIPLVAHLLRLAYSAPIIR